MGKVEERAFTGSAGLRGQQEALLWPGSCEDMEGKKCSVAFKPYSSLSELKLENLKDVICRKSGHFRKPGPIRIPRTVKSLVLCQKGGKETIKIF